MKKLTTLTLALIFCLSVCACTAEPTDTPAVTTDAVSGTAGETAADTTPDTTEAETDFVPTEDNVIWALADVTYIHDMWAPGERAHLISPCGAGKIYVQPDVLEAMKTSGDKRIAIEYYYLDGSHSDYMPPHDPPFEVPEEYRVDPEGRPNLYPYDDENEFWSRTCFLTADEINDVIDKVQKEIDGDHPQARFSIVSVSKYRYDTGMFKIPTEDEEIAMGVYGKRG